MRLWLAVLCACLTSGLRAQPEAKGLGQPASAKARFAIVAGVAEYPESSRLRRLNYAAEDVDLIAESLVRLGFTVRRLKNPEASAEAVRSALKRLQTLPGIAEGTVVFHFSGHGFAPDGRNTVLATTDAVFNPGTGVSGGLALAEVEDLLLASGARQALAFIDACRDDPVPGGKNAGSYSFGMAPGRGLRMLMSTSVGGVSWETPAFGHGVFSYFLAQALDGKAADRDGLLSATAVEDYVTAQVSKWSFENDLPQQPYKRGEWSGEFELARLAPNPSVATQTPVAPVVAVAFGAECDQRANDFERQRCIAESFWSAVDAGRPERSLQLTTAHYRKQIDPNLMVTTLRSYKFERDTFGPLGQRICVRHSSSPDGMRAFLSCTVKAGQQSFAEDLGLELEGGKWRVTHHSQSPAVVYE